MCYCTREQKINFEGFTQNGCYGNQPQPFEVVFYSIDASTSCNGLESKHLFKKCEIVIVGTRMSPTCSDGHS